jgi:hypothetical protein
MKYILLTILILLATPATATNNAINLDPLINVFNFKYPEERNKAIKIKKNISKLDTESQGRKTIENLFEQYNLDPTGDIMEQITKVGFNKFSMGTGLVDVTFQVKNGVEYALKDTLGGYPEYQRRKTTEEMLNSNFRSHRITNNFLIGSSNKHENNSLIDILGDIFNLFNPNSASDIISNDQIPSLIQTIKAINHQSIIQEIYHFFQSIAYSLLGLVTMFIIFQRLSSNEFHWEYSISNPLINSMGAALAIALVGDILDHMIKIFSSINSVILSAIFDMLSSPYSLEYTELADSWQTLVNQIGYMPGLILSIIDVLSQFFIYFFIAGLILSIVIGKILSPIWGLALVSDSLRSNSINSFIQWFKSLLVVVLIPVSYLIIKFIIQEFANLNLYFLEVSLSIASFLYLPALFNIILAKGHGIFQPAFSGYQSIVDNINSTYQGLKSLLEHNKEILKSQDY